MVHAAGENTQASARDVGKDLNPRLAFGWPAVRKRILIESPDMDDVSVNFSSSIYCAARRMYRLRPVSSCGLWQATVTDWILQGLTAEAKKSFNPFQPTGHCSMR